jgi:uncharacterized protein YndB with AHSA1/START domain
MSEKTQTLSFTQQIKAPVKDVYFALTNRTMMQSWFADTVSINAADDGHLYAWWNSGNFYAAGKYTKVEENKSLSLAWRGMGEPAESRLEFSLAENNGGTQVKVTHQGLGKGPEWGNVFEEVDQAWPRLLENLQWAMEKGVDKRVYDRPFMGIMIAGALDEKQAKKLGVPVKAGIRISGTLEGTGAAAVGLQNDDVLVKMGEHELTDFPSLTKAIGSFKAEQVVKTEFYRGGEKHSVDMTLSRRPYPEFPNTAKEFAAEMRKLYKELDAELEAAFEGVSEDEATARPGEEEWCAKEVIAHLIYTERWFQQWLSTAVAGLRAPGFNNDHGLIEAMSKAYPTTVDALNELKVCEQTSAAAVANLKDDFVSQKFNYYGLAAWPLQGMEPHTRGHITQIQEAVKAARKT